MEAPLICVATHAWEPEGGEHQMALNQGDNIDVKAADPDDGWWYGTNLRTQEEGYFPASYVEEKRSPPPFIPKPPAPPPKGNGNTLRVSANTFRNPTAFDRNTIRDIPAWSDDATQRQKKMLKDEKRRIKAMRKQIDQADPVLLQEMNPLEMKHYTLRNNENFNETIKVNQNSKTIWCVVAHYQGYLSGITCLWQSIVSFKWGSSDLVGGWIGFDAEWITAIYCLGVGVCVLVFERKWGVHLAQLSYTRPGAYGVLALPTVFSVSTMLAGLFLAMTSFTYGLAVYMKEAGFKFRKSRNPNEGKPYCERAKKWCSDLIQQNKWQKYTFALIWIIINIIIYMERCMHFNNVVAESNGSVTKWLSQAKAFGTMLDLNMAFMLIPVSKSLIRLIYNYSTDQTKLAKCLRVFLFIIPLDKAIQFHKFVAAIIMFSTIMHSFAHFMHYADVPATYDEKFGGGVWFTGVCLLVITQWIFSCALDVVRKVKFEIFYYIHHFFVGYYLITLFHGAGWLNPNFWKYLLLPGLIYLGERYAREKNSSIAIPVVSVTLMKSGNARVLCLELAKKGPLSSHKEGQYMDIKCPIISRYQWHPFTISSDPELDTVQFHIRDQGPGSWTNRVYTYFQALAGGSSTRVELKTRNVKGGNAMEPQSIGPDGLPLIQVNGPHSAPTQHLGEYKTTMIAGAGIGVTPLRATLQAVVRKFWFSAGQVYPERAYFYWLVSYKDLKTYMFMIRTIKECCDKLYDMRVKGGKEGLGTKSIRIHIWVTSVPRTGTKPYKRTAEEDALPDNALWGPTSAQVSGDKIEVLKARAPFDEWELFQQLWFGDKQKIEVGDFVRISRFYDADPDQNLRKERPDWSTEFTNVKTKHDEKYMKSQQPREPLRCGVMYCGPPAIADILKKQCGEHTDYRNQTRFILHKENF